MKRAIIALTVSMGFLPGDGFRGEGEGSVEKLVEWIRNGKSSERMVP